MFRKTRERGKCWANQRKFVDCYSKIQLGEQNKSLSFFILYAQSPASFWLFLVMKPEFRVFFQINLNQNHLNKNSMNSLRINVSHRNSMKPKKKMMVMVMVVFRFFLFIYSFN